MPTQWTLPKYWLLAILTTLPGVGVAQNFSPALHGLADTKNQSTPATEMICTGENQRQALDGALLFGIDATTSDNNIQKIIDFAPEIAIVVATSIIIDNKANQIDQAHTTGYLQSIPSRQFIEAAIDGQSDEDLLKLPMQPLPKGARILIESRAQAIADGSIEAKYTSTYIDNSGLEKKKLNEVTINLSRRPGRVPLNQFSDITAEIYGIDSTTTN